MKNKILILFMVCTSVISCTDKETVVEPPKLDLTETLTPPPKHDPTKLNPSNYLKDNVWVSSGIDFETGKPVVRNSITGQPVPKCRPPRGSILHTASSPKTALKVLAQGEMLSSIQQRPKPSLENTVIAVNKTVATLTTPEKVISTEDTLLPPCEMKVIKLDPRILEAINLSKETLTGTISHNGIEKEARINISFSFSYQGSFCTSPYIGGDQYSGVCLVESTHCTMYKNYIEPHVRDYYSTTLPENEIKKIILDALPEKCKTTKID